MTRPSERQVPGDQAGFFQQTEIMDLIAVAKVPDHLVTIVHQYFFFSIDHRIFSPFETVAVMDLENLHGCCASPLYEPVGHIVLENDFFK